MRTLFLFVGVLFGYTLIYAGLSHFWHGVYGV
jgi:hypothetical protein